VRQNAGCSVPFSRAYRPLFRCPWWVVDVDPTCDDAVPYGVVGDVDYSGVMQGDPKHGDWCTSVGPSARSDTSVAIYNEAGRTVQALQGPTFPVLDLDRSGGEHHHIDRVPFLLSPFDGDFARLVRSDPGRDFGHRGPVMNFGSRVSRSSSPIA